MSVRDVLELRRAKKEQEQKLWQDFMKGDMSDREYLRRLERLDRRHVEALQKLGDNLTR